MAQKNQSVKTRKINRRNFLKISGGAVGLLLAGMPKGWVGGVYAAGLFKKYGIESTISKEASWAVIRDRLTLGENQATHMLFGMPLASTMGLLGSPKKPMVIPFVLVIEKFTGFNRFQRKYRQPQTLLDRDDGLSQVEAKAL